jgi:hypothetical protein
VEYRKISCLFRESYPVRPARSPSLCQLSYPGSHNIRIGVYKYILIIQLFSLVSFHTTRTHRKRRLQQFFVAAETCLSDDEIHQTLFFLSSRHAPTSFYVNTRKVTAKAHRRNHRCSPTAHYRPTSQSRLSSFVPNIAFCVATRCSEHSVHSVRSVALCVAAP